MSRTPNNFFTAERQSKLETMACGLSESDLDFLKLIGEFTAKELWPKYFSIQDTADDRAAFRQAIAPLVLPSSEGGLDFRGCFLPSEIGGLGIQAPVYMMALEMIAQANPSIALSLLIDGSSLYTISKFGDEKQIRTYVTNAIEEGKMLSFALTEPNHGTDAANLETRAVLNDGYYTINGQKSWITNGGWADYYLIIARTDPKINNGSRGLSALLVHKNEIEQITLMEKKEGVKGSYTAELFFDDSQVPVEENGTRRMLGNPNQGYEVFLNLLNDGRVTVGAYSCGIAVESIEDAIEYGNNRQIDGKRLTDFQINEMSLARLHTELESARSLTYEAAVKMKRGIMKPHDASMAKLSASDLARRATLFNQELHGANGISSEFKAFWLVQDAYVGYVGEGVIPVQAARIFRYLASR